MGYYARSLFFYATKISKSDVFVAKNYLNEAHIKELNQIISAYLDLAENRAKKQIITMMGDWVKFLNSSLELSNYPILEDKGRVSMKVPFFLLFSLTSITFSCIIGRYIFGYLFSKDAFCEVTHPTLHEALGPILTLSNF